MDLLNNNFLLIALSYCYTYNIMWIKFKLLNAWSNIKIIQLKKITMKKN